MQKRIDLFSHLALRVRRREFRICKPNHFAKAFHLFSGHAATGISDPVIPAPFVVQMGIGPLVAFFDSAFVQELPDCGVKRTGTGIERFMSATANFAQHGIPVALTVRQCHQNMQ